MFFPSKFGPALNDASDCEKRKNFENLEIFENGEILSFLWTFVVSMPLIRVNGG
jgi:hypothetical protein